MGTDRPNAIRANQIKNRTLTKLEMDATNETVGYILTVQADGSVDWEASTGGGTTFRQTFVNGDLTASKIVITHNLNTEHPVTAIYDNSDNIIWPTEISYKTLDTLELDFTGMTPLTGTYKVRVIGSGGITGHTIQDADNDTKIQVEESADEDIIRFDTAGTERMTLDANGLKLSAGADVNEFSIDGTLLGDSNDAVPTEKAVKTYIAGQVTNLNTDISKNEMNIVLNAFRIAVNGSLTQFNMVDGIVDEYEDESGIVYLATPFSHYKLNDNLATTNVIDNGTGTNNGTASANTSTLSITGKINEAFDFTGSQNVNLDGLVTDIKTDTLGTVSVWFNPDNISTLQYIFAVSDIASTAVRYFPLLYIDTDGKIVSEAINSSGVSAWKIRSTTVLSAGTWYHLTIVHNGISPKLYVNGTEETNLEASASLTYWLNNLVSTIESGRIGSWVDATGENGYLDGQVDDFRYYQNKALTQAEINAIYNSGTGTEDEEPASQNISYNSTDDYYSPSKETDTKLLLHLNGADQATATTDDSESAHSITFNGTAQLDTAQKKFGTASLLLDGNSDYLTILDSDDWDIWGGDCTIDLWVRFNSVAQSVSFAGQYVNSTNFWDLYWHQGNSCLEIYICNNPGTFKDSYGYCSWSPSVDTWYHIAVVRSGNNNPYLFIDGVSQSVTFDSWITMVDYASTLRIGYQQDQSFYMNGWIDEIRISKGIARWTSNFTVPSSEHNTFESMTLISDSFTAEAEADSARIVLFEEDVDSITLNTDFLAYASRDDGTTYSQITLVDEGEYESGKNILSASVDISGQPTGTNMKYKIVTANNKDLKLHGTGLLWD